MENEKIRVLVVDDSPLTRDYLKEILNKVDDIEVIGTAENGRDALERTIELSPDVITMDVEMPIMDGIKATKEIMKKKPTPIIILTSSVNTRNRYRVFDVLKFGALEIMQKPSPVPDTDWDEMVLPLIEKIRVASKTDVKKRFDVDFKEKKLLQDSKGRFEIVAIASSTGGPSVLNKILSNLKPNFKLPIVVAQHISYGFTEGLVKWLNVNAALKVNVVDGEENLREGNVYFAPDGAHITSDGERIKPIFSPPVRGIRPSADILFESVSTSYGEAAIGIVLTGMGKDGVRGIERIKDMGGLTLAQEPKTAVISSMPENAIKTGKIDYVFSPKGIADFLNTLG